MTLRQAQGGALRVAMIGYGFMGAALSLSKGHASTTSRSTGTRLVT